MDYVLDDWKMILAPSALIICMLWDIAFDIAKDYLKVKISSWVPRNLFVLSALTIQILSYVDVQKVNVFVASNAKDMEVLVYNQLRMDAARLTMCVFVGCLLPGMAMVGTVGRWSNVAALFVSLSFHIAAEIYALQNLNNYTVEREAGPWFVLSGVLLLIGASSLLLLLGAVILSGKMVHDLFRSSISEILSKGDANSNRWDTLRSEVMKSWVVARAWKTQYFVYSSPLSQGAGMIVTICVAVMAAKVACRSSLLHNNSGGGNLTFYLQCFFILVGWILMLCRWFRAALYCATFFKRGIFIKIIRLFLVPAALVVNPLCPRLAYFLLNPKNFILNREFRLKAILISVFCLVLLAPLCVLVLAISLLWLFCFICWYFSALVFGSELVQHLCKLNKEPITPDAKTLKVRNILLGAGFSIDFIRTFWIVEKKSFHRIEGSMGEAEKIRQGCPRLLSIMENRRLPQNQRLRPRPDNSWMKTISSIFSDIAELQIRVDMRDAFAAYREIQDVLKFVDCPDNIVVDPFNIFGTLNFHAFHDSVDCEEEMRKVERKLHPSLGRSPQADVYNRLTRFSQNFLASQTDSNNLLIRLHDCKNMEELGDMLPRLVSHVIVSCLLEASEVLVEYTRHWAQNFEESKIEKAIELAGKVSALLECLVQDSDLHLGEKGQLPSQNTEG